MYFSLSKGVFRGLLPHKLIQSWTLDVVVNITYNHGESSDDLMVSKELGS
jgi:hypothetical protein